MKTVVGSVAGTPGEPLAGTTRVAPDAVVITRIVLLDEAGTLIAATFAERL